MNALTACQTAFLHALPSSLAAVYSLGLQLASLDEKFLQRPRGLRTTLGAGTWPSCCVAHSGTFCDRQKTSVSSAGVHPSVTESKRGRA